MAENNEDTAVSFVTKKVLVTFVHQIAIMFGGSCIYTMAAICEYQEEKEKRHSSFGSMPTEFTIVGLPDGRKLDRSFQLTVGIAYGVSAMVEID